MNPPPESDISRRSCGHGQGIEGERVEDGPYGRGVPATTAGGGHGLGVESVSDGPQTLTGFAIGGDAVAHVVGQIDRATEADAAGLHRLHGLAGASADDPTLPLAHNE